MNPQAAVTATIVAFPVGTVISYLFAATNLPTGWLLCDGSTFDQNQYPELYRMLGNKNTLPDLRGYFLRGLDATGKVDPDGPHRAPQSVQQDALGKHGHTYWRTAWYMGELQGGNNKLTPKHVSDGDSQSDVDNFLGGQGTSSDGDVETRPKNVAVNYLIFAGLATSQPVPAQ